MSLTSILARERVGQFERWELPVVGAPDAADAETIVDEGPQRPTVAEIEDAAGDRREMAEQRESAEEFDGKVGRDIA